MQQNANLRKRLCCNFLLFMILWRMNRDWFPALGALTFPQCYSHTRCNTQTIYLECRSQSQLLKDKRLNNYWSVWIVTCMKDVHTRVSIERWTSIDGLPKCVCMYQHRNLRYFENRSMQTSSMLEKYHKCRSVTLPWSKRFRTYCLLCHNKVGLAAA